MNRSKGEFLDPLLSRAIADIVPETKCIDLNPKGRVPHAGVCAAATLAAVAVLCPVGAQPFEPGQGLVPLGNLRTSDRDGPYNISLLITQANEIRGAQIAKGDFTDADLRDFLVNVECLEGQFDTWGAFGYGFFKNLSLGGPTPKGARKAHLSKEVRPFVEEIALSEQGHALFTRFAGSKLPCPAVDFDGGFNKFLGAAYGLKDSETVKTEFGEWFDPFANDENFLLSMLTLEEHGATGNKGLSGLFGNPVLATSVAGLATSATGFAAVERMLLWERRHKVIDPFNETVLEVFARVSALRDRLDGPPISDQGLVNTDPRFIAVPDKWVNMIPTDILGLTFNRAPQQLINILTLGDPEGKGCFFPEGLVGRLNKPTAFDKLADGYEPWPFPASVEESASTQDVGVVPPPISRYHNPPHVPGQDMLHGNMQRGHLMDETPKWRGLMQERGYAAAAADKVSKAGYSVLQIMKSLYESATTIS